MPANDVDTLAANTIKEILNSDLSKLPPETIIKIKQINWELLGYFEKQNLIKSLITKAIFTNNKITFFIDMNTSKIQQFIHEEFINQNNNPLNFITNDNQIIIEKEITINTGISTNKYNAGKTGLLNMTDNNHLITRAFAYAYKFKQIYEEHGSIHHIVRTEKMSIRTIYRYLNLAYLSPKIINNIMSGKITVNINTLFEISSKYDSFQEQEEHF